MKHSWMQNRTIGSLLFLACAAALALAATFGWRWWDAEASQRAARTAEREARAGEFTVRFDIQTDVSWLAPTLMVLVWLFFTVVLAVAVVQMRRARDRRVVAFGLFLALIVGIGGFVLPPQFSDRWQWVRAAGAGDYEVVEGPVTDLRHSRTSPNWSASYKVGGVLFRSSNDPFSGESPRTAEHGGPIREGAYLRIAHKGGRVLRVEVLDPGIKG